jgi:hypothetical protein
MSDDGDFLRQVKEGGSLRVTAPYVEGVYFALFSRFRGIAWGSAHTRVFREVVVAVLGRKPVAAELRSFREWWKRQDAAKMLAMLDADGGKDVARLEGVLNAAMLPYRERAHVYWRNVSKDVGLTRVEPEQVESTAAESRLRRDLEVEVVEREERVAQAVAAFFGSACTGVPYCDPLTVPQMVWCEHCREGECISCAVRMSMVEGRRGEAAQMARRCWQCRGEIELPLAARKRIEAEQVRRDTGRYPPWMEVTMDPKTWVKTYSEGETGGMVVGEGAGAAIEFKSVEDIVAECVHMHEVQARLHHVESEEDMLAECLHMNAVQAGLRKLINKT